MNANLNPIQRINVKPADLQIKQYLVLKYLTMKQNLIMYFQSQSNNNMKIANWEPRTGSYVLAPAMLCCMGMKYQTKVI